MNNVTLGDACEFLSGFAWSSKKFLREPKGLPVIRIQNVGHGINDDAVYWNEEYAPRFIIEEGDILLSLSGSFRAAEWNGPRSLLNQRVVKITPSENLDRRWFLRWLETQLLIIERMGRYALVNNVALGDLKKIEIEIPPLEEQRRIAAILDKANAIRRKREQALTLADDFLQATFLDMFGDPVTNPMEWKSDFLGEICDVRDGTHDSPKYVKDGHPLLTSKNFKDGAIDYEGANLITDEDFQQINKRSKVDIGDLVMPMIGTIGNPVLVDQEPDFAIKNVALIKFSATSPHNHFVRTLLCSHYFDHVTSKANRGGTQKFVALKDLRSIPVTLPPLDLQHRFAAIVESIEQQKASQRAHLDELDTLFASLQSRAFRGDL